MPDRSDTVDRPSSGRSATSDPVGGGEVGRTGTGAPGRPRTALWILGAASVALVLGRAVHNAVDTRQVDLEVYLMGASHVFDGRLYTAVLPGARLPFTYPPVAALLFVPLTALGRTSAQVAWAVVSAGVLVAFLAVSLRAVRPRWEHSGVVCWSLVLAYPAMALDPVGLTFSFGQINLVLALLVLADLTRTLSVRGHTLPRGVLTGVATAVKLTPGIFVPYLFLTRQVRAGVVALATFVAAGLALAALAPSESWSYWTRYVFDAHRVGGVVFVSNQSLRSTIVRFSRAHAPEHLIVALVVLAAVGGLAVAVWAARTSSPLLGVLVCAVTGLVVSPITWSHHLVWVVPVLLWLALADDRPAYGRLWAAAGTAWFWWGAIWRVPHGSGRELHDSAAQLILANSYTLVMLLFVGGVAVMLASRRRGHRRDGDPSAPSAPAAAGARSDPVG
jgi:alpha-1,2-mannosyltransferase